MEASGWCDVLLVEVAGRDAVEVRLDLVSAEHDVSAWFARIESPPQCSMNSLL